MIIIFITIIIIIVIIIIMIIIIAIIIIMIIIIISVIMIMIIIIVIIMNIQYYLMYDFCKLNGFYYLLRRLYKFLISSLLFSFDSDEFKFCLIAKGCL